MDPEWFLQNDLSRHGFGTRSWTVLRQLERVQRVGQYAEPGWVDEFRGVASAMYPASAARRAAQIQYSDINSGWPHRPFIQDGRYMSAGIILPERGRPAGRYLVLQQSFEGSTFVENWHLDQDLVLGLGLVRVADEWIAATEEGNVAARLHRTAEGRPYRVEILAEYLRDFLTARKAGLVITSYMSRAAVLEDPPEFSWKSGHRREVPHGHWEGFIRAVHPSGLPFGEKIAVTRVFRTDAHDAGDAPVFDMFDNRVFSEHYERGHAGGPFYHVEGSLHRTEWFGPGKISVRVRGDREPLTGIAYKIAIDGATAPAEDLLNPPVRYLYFRPEVVRELIGRASGSLIWYTEHTGEVGYLGHSVPFGVAENGLVNVVASDIAELPAPIQKTWLAHNVTPSGPVSPELLSAQMSTQPAATVAPEAVLVDAVMQLDFVWTKAFGSALIRPLDDAKRLTERACNRFQALNDSELRRLAKDVSRYVIERFDERQLRALASPPPRPDTDERRSLGLMEDILKTRNLAAEPVSVLRALNELRQDDSHLPAEDRTRALRRLGLLEDLPYPHKSERLIASTVIALDALAAEVAAAVASDSDRS